MGFLNNTYLQKGKSTSVEEFFFLIFFSEIPLKNKMYPKTTNENHFQTCLIQGWPTIQLKNGAYALFYCLIVGQPLKVKYLSDT